MAQAVEQVVNNLFKKVNSGPLPPDFLAKGDFYDYKNQLYFSVNIELGSTNNLKVTSYNIYIDTLVSSSVVKQINLLHQLNNSGDLNKNIDDFIIFSSTPRPNYLEYNFSNGTQYEIKHCIEVKDLTPSTPVVYKLEHSQLFTYHDPSVTLSDFTFDDNVSYGDILKISNLVLVNSDGTSPTNISFEFQEAEHTNDGTEPNEYFSYDLPYNPGGLYDIPNVQLTLGKVYKVQATASWVLGYTTFRRSTKNLYIYGRPTITSVEILPLSYKEASEDVIKITMGALSASGSTNPPSKLWFEFYNSNDTLVARAGGDPAANPVTGITASSNNIYLLKLSDIPIISGVGLLNDTSYYVKAVVRYEGYSSLPTATQFRLSDKSSTINFVKKVPVISNRTIYPLYTSTDNTILTINVDNARYELYAPGSAPSSAPSSVSGIKFYFYDESNLATSVASTSSYQFVNNGTNSSSNTYPILFSEITGTLVNNKDYRIRAEVQLVKHNGDAEQRLSVLSDATSSPDRVNFAEVSPEILSNTINPLYTIDDPSVKKILDIEVKKQAYELYVPNAIKFYFYDHSVSTTNAAASTKSYSFVNSSADSNYSYPILFTDVTTGSLVNNKDYRIKAEVTFADNQTRPSVLSDATSPPDKVNFAYVTPYISSITAYDAQNDGGNDGVGDDSTNQVIAGVYVNKEAYQLFAPNIAGAILFIFYNSSDAEVARTTSYSFLNSAPVQGSTTSLYNIQLNHIPSNSLKNGITYKVKARVSLGSGSSAEERLSSSFYENVIFSQNVAPVPSVNISNTWALVTANDPSSSPTRFNNSPLIGISGYFSKTAQFGSNYSNKHLDVDSTKFELEYKVDGGAWVYVKNAKLVLQGSEGAETLEEAADRARDASIITSSVGRYDNITGSGDGTEQGYIVFYIPQQQESTGNAFTESNKVQVRVTIIDTATLWGNSSNTRATTESSSVNPLQLINKINTYNYVAGAYTEPWNSVDSSSGKLLMNIPVAWNSIHADSVKVGVKYSSGGSYSYQTINYSSSLAHVSIIVEPTDGTRLYYSVAYIVKNVNLGSTDTTQGLIDEKNVDNKKFPVSSDYVISNLSYKTINSDNKSSVLFNLVINADSTSRIDGVNVYFTSPISIGTNPISNGSNIPKIRIGSSKISVTGKEITLTDDTALKTMDASGVIVTTSGYNWQHYDLAYISFEAFRDARVVSATATYNSSSDVSNPVSSNYYVESGGSPAPTTTLTQDVNRVWNVPKLTKPSADASGTNIYELSGGVLNIVEGSSFHVITWPTKSDPNSVAFMYDLTITRNEDTTPSVVDDTNLTGNSYVIPIVDSLDKYTIQVKKVFNGLLTKREISDPDTIVFYTAKVDTSAMVVSVQNPSNSSSVTLSWNSPVFTGLSVTGGEPDSAQFSHNVHTHYIQYRTGGSGNYSRLGPSSDPIIENSSPKTYTLPDTNLGTLYDFVMYVKAQVKFTLNGVVHSSKSLPFQVPLTSVTTASQYRVSTIPSIGLPSNTPVLISGEDNPTLLLDLNAKGLEDEGFISVVVVLTQDGTTNKPEGEQVLLVFPGTGSSFNFTNVLQGSGSGGADARLVGGESATSGPFDVTNSSVSTHNNNYTLKIGTTKPDGRYGYSTLSMPSSVNSGFVDSGLSSSADYNPINYMVILTTRRGTDIKVGDFVYQSFPAVQDVTITTSNGQYFVNFSINNI